MSIDLNQALEYAVAWAKEVGKIQLSYFRGNDLGIQTKSNVYDEPIKKVKLFCWIRFRSTIPGMQSLGKKAVLMPVLPSIGG